MTKVNPVRIPGRGSSMTRFEGTFQGHTAGGIRITAGGALLLIGAALVLTHRHQAAQDAGIAAGVIAVLLSAVLSAAVVTVLVLRVQGRRRNQGSDRRPSPLLCQVSPQSVPAREAPRAIAAPVQPIVNVNIDAGLLAGLMEAARQAPARVQPEQQELPR